jgi:PIN domain nuclease of toxin-antitoxin system
VRLLLDTHILLWALADDPALRPAWRATLDEAESLYVSAATVWEIAIKRALGKLRVDGDPARAAREAGCIPLPITWEHGEAAGGLPLYHGDPFDRLLIAQGRLEGLTIMTADAMFARYDVALA